MGCTLISKKGSKERWVCRTTEATEEYKKGIKDTTKSWGKCTCEAEDRYKAGVDAAQSRGAFKKGVEKVGRTGFLQKTLLKGPTRFAQGVADGADAYEEGYKPYHAHFPSIFMPTRFPRGDPRNLERCKAVCTAMGQKKVELAGTGKVTCPED
uniref:Uncharacterized protein n=1 Tax=viral metagenome TaxID=1070528 RepID=A0A6M3LCF5_9ZZZZ